MTFWRTRYRERGVAGLHNEMKTVRQPRVDDRYESEWWADYLQNRGVRQSASSEADASPGWRAPVGWTISAWVRNATNGAVLAATAAAGIPGPATAYLEPPRSHGFRVAFE